MGCGASADVTAHANHTIWIRDRQVVRQADRSTSAAPQTSKQVLASSLPPCLSPPLHSFASSAAPPRGPSQRYGCSVSRLTFASMQMQDLECSRLALHAQPAASGVGDEHQRRGDPPRLSRQQEQPQQSGSGDRAPMQSRAPPKFSTVAVRPPDSALPLNALITLDPPEVRSRSRVCLQRSAQPSIDACALPFTHIILTCNTLAKQGPTLLQGTTCLRLQSGRRNFESIFCEMPNDHERVQCRCVLCSAVNHCCFLSKEVCLVQPLFVTPRRPTSSMCRRCVRVNVRGEVLGYTYHGLT